jgi:hypothetical protein
MSEQQHRINEKVLYKGRSVRVLEYSEKFKQYTVVYEGQGALNGYVIHDAAPEDMEPLPVYITATCTKCYLGAKQVLKGQEKNYVCVVCKATEKGLLK